MPRRRPAPPLRPARPRAASLARWVPVGLVVAAVAAAAALPPVRRRARQTAVLLRRKARHLAGRSHGVAYRLSGRHPAREVSDPVLAQRIRSTLGPLQKQLDIPHVHVTVCDHIASLHGAVDRTQDAHRIEHTVLADPGVDQVISHLRVGLGAGDTRPRAGRAPAHAG